MVGTDDDIDEVRDTSDHEYGSNESQEEKIGGQSEVEEGFDGCGDEDGVDVEEEKKQLQECPENKYQSFEDTATGKPRIEAAGKGIDRLEPTIGGKSHETKTGTHFFQTK